MPASDDPQQPAGLGSPHGNAGSGPAAARPWHDQPTIPVGTGHPTLPVGGSQPTLPVGGGRQPTLPVGGTSQPTLPVGGGSQPTLPVGGTSQPTAAMGDGPIPAHAPTGPPHEPPTGTPSRRSRAAAAGRAGVQRLRGAARADGAGDTGLANLIEMHALGSAGDALVAIGLAGTLFFNVPTGEARGKVALYLLLTLAPFALLAPVIGPALDRIRRGRRLALATTLVLRALLAVALARAITTADPLTLYPEAFGILILSKAYSVSRSAVVPRLLPHGLGLVRANARLSLAALVTASAAAPLGGLLSVTVGPEWALRLAAAFFLVSAGLSFGLPATVDSDAGEIALHPKGTPLFRRPLLVPMTVLGPAVRAAMNAAAGLRALNGFLTLFLAFLVRTEAGLVGHKGGLILACIIIAAAAGGFVGMFAGARLPYRAPDALVALAAVLAAVSAVLAALLPGLPTVLLFAGVSGLTQSLSKLGLDAVIQRDVGDEVRSSAFARSETTLQLAWVVGGGLGLAMPMNLGLGMLFAALGTTVSAVVTVVAVRRSRARPAAHAPTSG